MTYVKRNLLIYTGIFVLWASFVFWRLLQESSSLVRGGLSKSVVGSQWDPRGFEKYQKIIHQRESDAFRSRVQRGLKADFTWPGLESMQRSFTWLELLEGLHNPSSVEGDFSWMFSKLYTVIDKSSSKEIYFISSLAPYFIVMGHDFIGGSLVMSELIHRQPEYWKPWFWSGYHAMENLHLYNLASDYYQRSSLLPGGPAYAASLAARLLLGSSILESSEREQILTSHFPPVLLEKIKKAHPEWFRESL